MTAMTPSFAVRRDPVVRDRHRERELAALDRLVRERPQPRPPLVAPSLAQMARRRAGLEIRPAVNNVVTIEE
jgi:hypothetical protein